VQGFIGLLKFLKLLDKALRVSPSALTAWVKETHLGNQLEASL